MYLGNEYGVKALNHFLTGFMTAGCKFNDEEKNYPNFILFTDWLNNELGNTEARSWNWSGVLLEKYKDDKKALDKFFYYLNKFKDSYLTNDTAKIKP
jgi:hypothetical protein